ncbi:uncharacterized protein DUF3613 [Collimonas sp. PA-H2]|uniref:DUF3613 domain-containing protein n=1 Tax=Collimonas sp. PA-H2 TaxID=1881062 RepID=UPI000BF8FC86|nr:DUF3613 domain-containing protein [Collimonas sp. PA-H2]PFH10765.1 uncharacterized protein DUF3613 [Collimonas sp. PA-H2]
MEVRAIFRQHTLLIGALLLMASSISEASAQSMTPLTGKLLQEPVAVTPNPSASSATPAGAGTSAAAQVAAANTQAAAQPPAHQAPVERESRIRVGDVTRTLLQAQADGRVAGPRLPILGATADASWQRYLDSFKHPLPDHFENTVSKSSSN